MIIGTAGHIDHGKTALIKALTGVDADRLKEEKARGITIDLGYAYYELPNGQVLGFVDVPGHERFVHNMLAGVTGIDCVLLTVAADDGVMPQTREHVAIIDLLGITRGIVALTKIDRVDSSRVAQVKMEIEGLLADTTLAGSPVFAVSSISREGVEALRSQLELYAVETGLRSAAGHFRQAIDRCFTLAGIGTVVTGTVFSGSVCIGDRLLLSPAGKEVRVRAIHAQNRESARGEAGQRCALNIVGVERKDIARGDWLLAPLLHRPSERFDARVRVPISGMRALHHWTPVHVHIGAADVSGRISLLEGEGIEPGATAYVQVVLDCPVGSLCGDRFILRDQSAQHTLAGGVVIDPFAPSRKVRTPQRLALLDAMAHVDFDEALKLQLQTAKAGVDLDAFVRGRNLREDVAAALFAELPMVTVQADGGQRIGFSSDYWVTLQQSVLAVLAAAQQRSPEILGMQGRQLRRQAAPEISWEVFLALVAQLIADDRIKRHGPWLHLPGHRVSRTPVEEKLWRMIAPLLNAKLYQPPWVRDIARELRVPESDVRLLLQRTTLMGDTHEIVHDRYFSGEAIARIASIASEIASERTEVRAAELRDRLGIGRKLAIQILEYFDRAGVSRRVGDAHRMRAITLLADDKQPSDQKSGTRPATQNNGRDSHPGGAT